ncbi:hypothetical protein ABBQ38_006652 [Trebouxia sp. C0009 RCD-2024]
MISVAFSIIKQNPQGAAQVQRMFEAFFECINAELKHHGNKLCHAQISFQPGHLGTDLAGVHSGKAVEAEKALAAAEQATAGAEVGFLRIQLVT